MENTDTISPPMVKMNIVLNYTEHGPARFLTVKNEYLSKKNCYKRANFVI
jgi:hypothetical protein